MFYQGHRNGSTWRLALGSRRTLWLKGRMSAADEVVRRRVRAVKIAVRAVKTPLGTLRVAASYDHVLYLELPHRRGSATPGPPLDEHALMRGDTPALRSAVVQLQEYFAGTRRRFDLPLAPRGTPFQLRVWRELRKIPYGRTITYAELARRAGNDRACRAVGAANGRNPLPIIVPCHRVIGTDGSLTGFGGGIEAKRKLLSLEGAWTDA